MKSNFAIRVPRLSRGRIFFWGFTLALGIGLFFFVQHLTACWQLTALPGSRPDFCSGEQDILPDAPDLNVESLPDDDPLPEIAAPEIEMPRWDGGSRVNIVFFGLRGGDISGEGCPACTDTIILLTVDPITNTAGMLSIPRDMWVNIPGFGYSRINTAWTIGEAARLPSGGPGLAMETVSQFIGVPVNYYVQVDFDTFISLIDLIDGIDVYIDEEMTLELTGNGLDHIDLPCCGIQHMNGKRALAYARCRKESQGCSGGDVGRAERQQKVIMAIRDKVLDPKQFQRLLAQAPQIYEAFSAGVHTNMPLEDAMKLAVLAKDIPAGSIKRGVIDNNMALFATVTLDGVEASVLRSVPDLIRLLRDEIFTMDGPVGPLAVGDAVTLMQADAARVRIVNNTYTSDLGERTTSFLADQGMNVVEQGIPTGAADQTVLIMYSPKLYALRYLIGTFGVRGSNQVVVKPDLAETVDIEIRLGNVWVSGLPTGY
jgi:LCP family protein required for cell wall assembly